MSNPNSHMEGSCIWRRMEKKDHRTAPENLCKGETSSFAYTRKKKNGNNTELIVENNAKE